MRRSRSRRHQPFVYTAVGAAILMGGATAAAAAPSAAIQAKPKRRTIAYGERAVVSGRAPASQAGQTVTLQFAPTGSSDWRQVADGQLASDGRFRLAAYLTRTGWIRVAFSAPASAAAIGLPGTAQGPDSSSPQRVAVAAAVRLRPEMIAAFGERTIGLRGRLLPALPWRRVLLQAERGGRWVTLSAGHTNRAGEFKLRYRAGALGYEPLRVRFTGDSRNAAVSARAGSLTGYQQTVASWYYDGGSTACGFHAYYGVANLSLPCGARVDFVYNGRHVQAVVDDRGPYVGGRTWDLDQNTAAALGFGGVGAVWSSS